MATVSSVTPSPVESLADRGVILGRSHTFSTKAHNISEDLIAGVVAVRYCALTSDSRYPVAGRGRR